ncbi:hypothetical protein [Brunnivagina elsteri]|uniref:hypothetical protein n=1 Tax=Brunnivagina elsteri TaxID=1247191 RepID=UPI001B80925E|nr:hypothetical protein [Calothrix elsteri]
MASGIMVTGEWIADGNQPNSSGEFREIPTKFRDRIDSPRETLHERTKQLVPGHRKTIVEFCCSNICTYT